jgi:hypothetical protein
MNKIKKVKVKEEEEGEEFVKMLDSNKNKYSERSNLKFD